MEKNSIDITEGLERIKQMFSEDKVHKVRAPKDPIEAMKASGIDIREVKMAVGGRLENILQAEQIDQTSWQIKFRRITPSGNYTETITVTTNSDVLSEDNVSPRRRESVNTYQYRLTPREAAEKVAEALGNHLIKVEPVRGDDNLLSIHIRESYDERTFHRIFSDLNASLHHGGWHATIRENKRWTMSPMAGSFLESRASESIDTYYNESSARKRAFKAGYPMTPLHATAHSTDTVMYPAIGDNDNFRDNESQKEQKTKKSNEKEVDILSKVISANGDFL